MRRRSVQVPLIVLAVAVAARFVILSFRLPLGGTIPFNPQLETYSDFSVYYLGWIHSLQSGLLPYRDFFYQYPPLFLYVLYPFYLLGGTLGPALAIVLADSGSAVLIYLLAKQFTSSRVATIAGLGYALSPFAILYEGYVLFSLQPMLFFLLLSILLIRTNRLSLSVVSFAFAVLFKQEAIFILPAYLIYARRFGLKRVARSAVVFASILVAVSLPFLILSPVQYLSTLAYHPPSYASNLSATTSTCFYSLNPTVAVERCIQGGVTSQPFSIPQLNQILDVIFTLGLPAVLLLPLPFLFLSRKNAASFELTGAYSFAIFVTVFAYFFSYVPLEEVARYPYLPVWALLLVSGTSWRTPVTALSVATLSLLLPTGVIQLALPFFAIWAVMVVDSLGDKHSVGVLGQGTQNASGPSPRGDMHLCSGSGCDGSELESRPPVHSAHYPLHLLGGCPS